MQNYHFQKAQQIIDEIDTHYQDVEAKRTAIAKAQVHATLAGVEATKALNETITRYSRRSEV